MKYEYVRSDECASQAALLREGLAYFGIEVNPTSDVARMIEALEWLGSFPPDAVQPDTAFAADQKRALRAFPLYEQALRIARALAWARTIPGAREKMRFLKKRLNRLETQDERAQDYLFELEIAERLARQGHALTFAEPDIVLETSGGEKLGLACKRPRNVRQMRERLKEASVQITSRSFPGVIVIGVELLFHKSSDRQRPTILYLGDPPMVAMAAYDILEGAVRRARPEITAAFERGVEGILFCGIVTGWARKVVGDRSAYHFQWIHKALSHPGALGLAEVLEAHLFPDSKPPNPATESG
jgi:hypothetical protein